MKRFSIALLALLSAAGSQALAHDLSAYRMIDLTHSFNEKTVYWPTDTQGFKLEQKAHGKTDTGFFYAANAFCTAEHGGTHLDAPLHFAEGKRSTEQIPLRQLIAPAVVIDVSKQAAGDRDYRLSREDVLKFEKRHGKIAPGTIVILRTGWSKYWPDRKKYLGDDTPGDASKLSFPSFGAEAAKLLVEERKVAMLGVDTASIDYGRSKDFIVHRTAAAQDVAGLENLTNLEKLPAIGATVIALPMKIEGGTGGPTRVVALIPKSGSR
ncbi:MAG TPA: cyclase family protein [Burkholderiales bacterium]|nr:cyclase family protein [Burkholderiales bacterium]